MPRKRAARDVDSARRVGSVEQIRAANDALTLAEIRAILVHERGDGALKRIAEKAGVRRRQRQEARHRERDAVAEQWLLFFSDLCRPSPDALGIGRPPTALEMVSLHRWALARLNGEDPLPESDEEFGRHFEFLPLDPQGKRRPFTPVDAIDVIRRLGAFKSAAQARRWLLERKRRTERRLRENGRPAEADLVRDLPLPRPAELAARRR